MYSEHNLPQRIEQTGDNSDFRELRPEQFWGANIHIQNLSESDFAGKIGDAAKEANFTYAGYLQTEQSGFRYHFSRYPRRAFGPVPSIKDHQRALRILAEKLGTNAAQIQEETLAAEPKFRILLGLQEGYAESRKQSILKEIELGQIVDTKTALQELRNRVGDLDQLGIKTSDTQTLQELTQVLQQKNLSQEHSIAEVHDVLGEDFTIEQAKIFTVGHWGMYQEPAVIINGDTSKAKQVYDLAAQFHQARIAMEDAHSGQSHMVETKYCEDPDKE